MKKKIRGILLIALILGVALNLYLKNGAGSENVEFSCLMNFYKEEYDERYSRYEKKLEVLENSSEIAIIGKTKSGKIDIQIINNDSGKTHDYSIKGIVNEKIMLSGEHSLEWTAVVDCYEDTEGGIEILVK